MLFPTLSFAAFFAVVLPVSWLLMPHRVRWRLFMVGASWFFYGAADWRFVPLLAGSTVVNHFFARRIYHATGPVKRTWTVAAVTTNLAVLAWFKYIGFLSLSLQSGLRFVGIGARVPLPEVLLPVGISFFTFQALSYVIDTYRGKIEPVSLLEFGVYLSFFPHLVAGPIVRATEFLPQIKEKISPRHVDVGKAFWLISLGLFKKVVIASYLGTYAADPLFGFPRQHAGFEALFGVYAYAIQIYADFSGYTDIAIGLALLLGIEFPQNFNAPYAAASLQDFWRRWHMTLSRWLRDYVYIPLGGSRKGRARTYVNLMITMLLGGLWHGAAWTFVAWGGLHGAGLAFERWRGERPTPDPPVPKALDRENGPLPEPAPPSEPEPAPVEPAARPRKVVILARDVIVARAKLPLRAPAPVPVAPPNGNADDDPTRPLSRAAVAQATGRPAPGAGFRRLDAGAPPASNGGPPATPALSPRARLWVGRLITFHVVCLAWIFFRATSFHNAIEVLGRIATLSGRHQHLNWKVVAVVVAALAIQVGPRGFGARLQVLFSRCSFWVQALVLAAMLTLIDLLGPAGVAPFIYFRF
jgi:D-alanyl-lipoteichoic acid acyltransferase DltB (MBOAT superfamily)